MARLQQSGMTIPSLDYATLHGGRFLHIMAKAIAPHQKPDLPPLFKWAGVTIPRHLKQSIKPLIRAASRNPHCNGYHNQWHNWAVMASAAVLARLAGLGRDDMAELLISALIHDLDHRGRMMSSTPFAEEYRSAQIATRRLLGKHSSQGVLWRRFYARLKATAFHGDDQAIAYRDEVTRLLQDADILASCFLPMADAKRLSRSVMREQSQKGATDAFLKTFIKTLAERGFAHPVTEEWAMSVKSRKTAVWIDPPSAKTLGFSHGSHND